MNWDFEQTTTWWQQTTTFLMTTNNDIPDYRNQQSSAFLMKYICDTYQPLLAWRRYKCHLILNDRDINRDRSYNTLQANVNSNSVRGQKFPNVVLSWQKVIKSLQWCGIMSPERPVEPLGAFTISNHSDNCPSPDWSLQFKLESSQWPSQPTKFSALSKYDQEKNWSPPPPLNASISSGLISWQTFFWKFYGINIKLPFSLKTNGQASFSSIKRGEI